ncbi:MAG: phosphate/phosphite/phosphonate ABC transporter substrate-binding protein [Rhodocyclaceae bacterium]
MTKSCLKLLFACWLLPCWTGMVHAANELVFGIYPLLSPSQTIERFAPLAEHLSKTLGMPITLRSAPDFAKFIERTRAGEYDIILTAPHMGRLAEKRDGYRRLAQTGYQIVVVVVARKDGPVQGLADLKGRSLAVGAQLSMSYQIADQALGRHGLALGRDVKFINTASFSNVLEALTRGEADASAIPTILWDTAPDEQREPMRVIHRSAPVPGLLLLAHSRLAPETIQKLELALIDFKNTEAGKAYFRKTNEVDFRPLDAATMKRIDPYTAVFDNR